MNKLVKVIESPNILLIIVDALRTENLGCYGYSKPTSSNIDSLAREGVLFENAYSCVNATDASLTTIFSGKFPTSHGIISHGGRVRKEDIQKLHKSGIRFLPEILKSKGYTTLAVDWLGRWHRRGYDYYSGVLHHAKSRVFPVRKIETWLKLLSRSYARIQKSSSIDEASLVTAEAKNLITKNREKSFFLFVHYWDTHVPYAPPTEYYRNNSKRGLERILHIVKGIKPSEMQRRARHEILARYNGSIEYVDHEIGRLIEHLKVCEILDQTLIILTSDHGESLTEHGIYFGHICLYDAIIHVPLIFRYSGMPKNRRIRGFVQHFDIVPTILDLLDVKNKDFDGKSVMPLIYGETNQLRSAVFAEEAHYQRKRAIRTSSYKYIHALSPKGAICRNCGRIHGGMEELYDLHKDPKETQNIIKDKPDVANALKERLSKWIDSLSARRVRSG